MRQSVGCDAAVTPEFTCPAPDVSSSGSRLRDEIVSLITRVANVTCEERFPNALQGMQVDDGMIRGHRQQECQMCGRPTHWYQLHQQAYVCSEDCLLNSQSAGNT